MDKKILYGIIIIITISIVISYSYINIYSLKEKEFEYSYRLEINTNSAETYYLYLPILTNISEKDHDKNFEDKFLNGMQVLSGNLLGKEIINSKFGKALKITGRNMLLIESKFASLSSNYVFTLRNSSRDYIYYEGEYWIFLNNTSNNSLFKLNIICDILNIEGWQKEIFGNINNEGWQLVSGFEKYIHGD